MSSSTTLDRPDTATTQEIDTDLDATFREIVGTDESTEDGTGDHERLSHYVSKEDIFLSATTRKAVFALCGKKWAPSRNPENYPVCPECKTVYDEMKPE